MDPATRAWDRGRCEAAGVPIGLLPPIRPATAVAGALTAEAADLTGWPGGVPVVVGAGDVPASQIGAGAIVPGDTHLSLGTAVYFGITTDTPLADPAHQLGVIGHADPERWILWLEIATGGGALEWLRRILDDLSGGASRLDHATIERLVAGAASGMDELLFVPWLTGERVPLFDDTIRGAFVGLSLSHGRGHLVRAVMEGVASQIAWAYEYGLRYGVAPGPIRAVGGGSIGQAWTAMIAEALDRPLEVVADPQEAAARGAAACALVGLGLVEDFTAAARSVRVERVIVPDPAAVATASDRGGRFRALYEALAPLGAGSTDPTVALAGSV
jgi:xylulokinase